MSAHAEVCHNTLVDFTGEEAFEAADDLASGPAASRPAGDVVDRRLVEPHADDDRAMEGGVRLSVPAPIETMPAGRHPGRSRDRAGTAQLRTPLSVYLGNSGYLDSNSSTLRQKTGDGTRRRDSHWYTTAFPAAPIR